MRTTFDPQRLESQSRPSKTWIFAKLFFKKRRKHFIFFLGLGLRARWRLPRILNLPHIWLHSQKSQIQNFRICLKRNYQTFRFFGRFVWTVVSLNRLTSYDGVSRCKKGSASGT